ncbi:uncharacterized protein LOC123539697 [Mercenaria mercenaria]|uniref:uncharacterized protein LOC123539697 n=1 Tax=Mercenaria mercenaria TaxID=6596 RepID=UPI00234F4674|nr:uncharacterized protein LOC123539697 [Mercenaria mercenaria]
METKRVTSHEKGKCPEHALTKRRGKVEVKYIEDKNKRNQTRSTRKTGLFKKALEYATMTGDSTRLEIRDEYFDSFEEGLVSDQSNADVVITEVSRIPPVPHYFLKYIYTYIS